MKCFKHPDKDAAGACVYCGKIYCSDCLVEVKGKMYCKDDLFKVLYGAKEQSKQNEMAIFSILVFLCFGFGVIDFAGMFFGYDLTGVSWSPIVAGVVGSALMRIGGGDESADSKE